MKLLINKKEETLVYTGETLGDLMVYIEQGNLTQGKVILSIKIDGKEFSLDSSEIRQAQLSEIKTLELEVSTLSGIIDKNIENADDYLKRLIPGIQKAAELFRMGNEQEANQFFINIIDGMDWFTQVLDIIFAAKEMSPTTIIDGKSIQDRQTNFVGFTQQMVEANKNKDWVLLADLLEYEILPYYKEWSNFLPQFHSK